MAAKRIRKPKKPIVVDLEFKTPADFRMMKRWAAELPERYGINLGEKGWQLPADQSRFLEAMAVLKGKIIPLKNGDS
jgi:hypothetical protein